jgi:hypothetical protein
MNEETGRRVDILTETGEVAMTMESIYREGNKLVLEGKMMGAWKSKMYLSVDMFPKLIRLMLNWSLISYILVFPLLYFKAKGLPGFTTPQKPR